MNVEVLDISLETGRGNFEEKSVAANASVLDARRAVEEKIEEMRLLRETQEYDFDF